MMFGGQSFGSSALASLTPLSTAIAVDPWAAFPITILHNNVYARDVIKVNSLSIDDTQGEQVTASFVFVNPADAPAVGDPFEVRYFDQVIFSGTIDKIQLYINVPLLVKEYSCSAVDWTQILVRRKINRRFTDLPLSTLVTSVIENELSGEDITYGSTDEQGLMELVDAQSVSVFELLRDVAGVTGQVLYMEFDKTLRFRSASNPSAPFSLVYGVIENASLQEDRENYRNVQTVLVTGTPASQSEDPTTVQIIQENDAQIAARLAIEGGSGRYEHIQKITHPTSNTQTTLARLGETYATLLLAIGGTPRRVLSARVRGYGFRAGQVATVNLEALGLSGTWLIQRVSIREEDGQRLVHDLELVESSLQQRVYESWASIIGKGQVVISVPSAGLSSNTQSYATPGSYQWVSTIDGTITLTTMGGSGGGGGAARITCGANTFYSKGGTGGASGKTVSSVTVAIGDTLDIIVGAKGTGGSAASGVCVSSRTGTDGSAGATSSVIRTGVMLSRAYGGGGGAGGHAYDPGAPITYGCVSQTPGSNGSAGGGSDGVVTTGGGKAGGARGNAGCSAAASAGANGLDGSVTIEY